jgi:hypothetical protein
MHWIPGIFDMPYNFPIPIFVRCCPGRELMSTTKAQDPETALQLPAEIYKQASYTTIQF